MATMPSMPSFDASSFKAAFDDMAARAHTAYAEFYAKSTAVFTEANDFAKGNAEAMVEAGKRFTAGLESIAGEFVADSKGTYEALSADTKAMAAAKSPTELVTLQGEMAKKHFDNAVAVGSKHTEAMMKFAGEVVAPISNRVALAADKMKTPA